MAVTHLTLHVRVAWWVNVIAFPLAKLSARCGIYPNWIERIVVAHGVKTEVH